MIWMSDWVDSRYVYCYSLETGKYYTKMQCRPMPYWCQGIFIADGKMLFAADDGESTFHIADNIYIADITEVPFTGLKDGSEVVRDTPFSVALDKKGNPVKRTGKIAAGAKAGRLELFREMSDFRRAGEIEGSVHRSRYGRPAGTEQPRYADHPRHVAGSLHRGGLHR